MNKATGDYAGGFVLYTQKPHLREVRDYFNCSKIV